MYIKIHRGAEQIGGCITEISSSTSRVFIDMGDNLPGENTMSEQEKSSYVSSIFAQNIKENTAVIYTHAHADHIGMMTYVPDYVPQYMSEETKRHCIIKYNLLSVGAADNEGLYENSQRNLSILNTAKCIDLSTPVTIGDIKVWAYEVPHSAYGSIMLLIELDGKRILHTGDFKRSGLCMEFLDQIRKIGKVDVVITEGTMLNRQQTLTSEDDVCKNMIKVMKKHKYVFVLTSSLNIDRLASISKSATACRKPITVCSSMMRHAFITYKKDYPEIFNAGPTYYPFSTVNNGNLQSAHKIAKFELWVNRCGFVQCVGIGQFEKVRDMLTSYKLSECALIYSMWTGYYTIPEQIKINSRYKDFRELFENIYDIHTSGHADCDTIAEMLTILNPTDGIIGIHKEHGISLTSLDIPEELKNKIIPDSILPDYVTLI